MEHCYNTYSASLHRTYIVTDLPGQPITASVIKMQRRRQWRRNSATAHHHFILSLLVAFFSLHFACFCLSSSGHVRCDVHIFNTGTCPHPQPSVWTRSPPSSGYMDRGWTDPRDDCLCRTVSSSSAAVPQVPTPRHSRPSSSPLKIFFPSLFPT
ncbi:hypothetical protein B0T10DRAFT_101167 [Thelonectria olida]|uniref:Uncharacterized protein n=1 Tax=Thelonectria olida TaxID=1576542 RepID=A0A9P8WFR8_9HYPO|nr:hypothetical protein B0T10DRAFT_101167 [Thelonectria olida]